MNKNLFLYIAAGLLLAISIFAIWHSQVNRGQPIAPPPPPANQIIQGKIAAIAASTKVITIESHYGKTVHLALTPETKLLDENNQSTTLTYFRPTFVIETQGIMTKPDSMLATTIAVIKVPNILVQTPQPNQLIGPELVIGGEARVFENQLNFRLQDGDGMILVEAGMTAGSPDVGQFGPYEVRTFYPAPKSDHGTLGVFDFSAKDGSEIDKVIVPVRFGK